MMNLEGFGYDQSRPNRYITLYLHRKAKNDKIRDIHYAELDLNRAPLEYE
jgi:hypothetical protein